VEVFAVVCHKLEKIYPKSKQGWKIFPCVGSSFTMFSQYEAGRARNSA